MHESHDANTFSLFHKKLLDSVRPPEPAQSAQQINGTSVKLSTAVSSTHSAKAAHSSSLPQPNVTAYGDRDAELLRIVQEATKKPRTTPDNSPVVSNSEEIMAQLKTAKDVITFFSNNGSSSSVKYVFLNRVPQGLTFRPYDLQVAPKGTEEADHYIMSPTGIVHVRPGSPSSVMTLADWIRESSLFNVLRKIPFFKNYLLSKTLSRLHEMLRLKKYAAKRKLLSRDLLLARNTFCGPSMDLLKISHNLTTVALVAYQPQGRYDYSVEEFHVQQMKQQQEAAQLYTTTMESIEGKLIELTERLERRTDIPDLNTREALEQYLLTVSLSDNASGSHTQRKTKSMLDARKEQFLKMQELKKGIVEFSRLDCYIRFIDLIASEILYRHALSAAQGFLNTLRYQGRGDDRSIGFQILLHPTEEQMLFRPAESAIVASCVEVLNGCIEAAGVTSRLCLQKPFKRYFARLPKVWNVGTELRQDTRMVYFNASIKRLIHQDYEYANGRMGVYETALPHIHLLQKSWDDIQAIWKQENNEESLSFLSLAKLYHRLQEAEDGLRVLISSFIGNTLWINAMKLKTEIEPRMHVIREDVNVTLRTTACHVIRELHTYFRQKIQVLNDRPSSLEAFADYVSEYQEIVKDMPRTESMIAQAESLCDLMNRQQVEFVEDEDKQLKERTLGNNSSSSVSLHGAFDEARLHAEAFIEETTPSHVESLQSDIANVEDECLGLQQVLLGDEFVSLTDDTDSILEYLDDIRTKLEDIHNAETQSTRFAELFNQPPIDWSAVANVNALYDVREEMWSLLALYNEKMDYWFDCPLKDLNTMDVEDEVNGMIRRVGNANRTLQEHGYPDELAAHLLDELQAVRQNMSVIHDCGNPHMTPEHWNAVLGKMVGFANSYHDGLNLRTLEEHDIFTYKDVLAEQSGFATGEWRITNEIDTIREVWSSIDFSTAPYKNRDGVFILDALEDIIQQLEEHQIELQTTMASRFIGPMREKVESWMHSLRLVSSVIDEWITLQKNWMYLEFIFSSDDIKEQLPSESDMFNEVDHLFRSLTSKAHTVKNVLQISTEEGLLAQLKNSNDNIDHILKKLEDYLETKRIAFPRFYFLSNDELLSILSDVRNPKAVQPHLSKCFDSIASLIFADEAGAEIIGMKSGEGESVLFESAVYPVGNVEQWLTEIESMMKASLLMHMRTTVEASTRTPRENWFFDHPAQCIQAVDMVRWTGETERAITSNTLAAYHMQYQEQLLRMVDLVKTSLSKLDRTLVCTLIVLDVHNRDIVETLKDHKVSTVSDFSWSQQLRYYWERGASQTDGMSVSIHHCNAHLWYGYEYLGNQPRLVITPLTDRAFLTCTNALSMDLGAAPQGPAGTGKTESVKDLGKALARQVVVFNCSDGINYKTMSRMFAGLAQAGAWACFDEFNRIELEVLSVIAQQMLEITTALKLKQDRMNFDGHPISLSKNFGVFITMNPGYAGRTELPDNLKALFRPICMMIPDYALIAEIMFYSEGFADARTLAQKMVQLYKLSSEQLSKQDHYDFGMRAVKSILVMAGSLKRQHPTESEDVLLIRSMRGANVPKFLRDDTVLFMALVRDLFPTVHVKEDQNELLVRYISKSMEAAGLQVVEGMVIKAQQLYDTLAVRHGVMMVGQTYTGKSTVVRTVKEALTNIKADGADPDGEVPLFNTVHTHVLNPKSITMGELYGQVNEITREWADGVLSDIARNITRAAQTQPDRHWVVFDGPVDAVWIENMNTVLDDNKLLCLFNGERIKLPPTATFMFEVQDLKVASPATVSRCGMVYLEPYYLDGNRGWTPIAQSLVNKRAAANAAMRGERLMELLLKLLPETLDFIRSNCREWIPSVDAQLAVSCIELLYGFVQSYEGSHVWPRGAVEPIEKSSDAEKSSEEEAPHNPLPRRSTAANFYEPPSEFQCPEITAATASAADPARLFDMYFVMAFVWSVGGNLRDDAREAFSCFAKERLSEALPGLVSTQDACSAYDYVVHRPSLTFITWNHLIPRFLYSSELPYFALVVPTVESVALNTLLGVITSTSRHVLVNGVTGTGKSLGVMNFIQKALRGDDPSGSWEYMTTELSAQTRSKNIKDRLEAKLYKVRSTALGPTPGKRAVFFVDDLNMPTPEKYGASPPLELLRQLITQGGFYDTHKSQGGFKEIQNVVLLAACGIPGGGRHDMTSRLTSHFHLLCQPAVSGFSTRRIFGSILHGFFNQWHSGEILDFSLKLVEATTACYQRITRELLPTPTRSHYTFNLRDISKVIQGMMQVSPVIAESKESICRLFIHEVSRVFHDRLIDHSDRRWWWQALEQVTKETLQIPWSAEYPNLLFGDFMRRDRAHYEEITDHSAIQETFAEYQRQYNVEYNASTSLVFFGDAVNHLSRICRVLRQPRGSALLVGLGGTGRQSLCKLASFICNIPIREVAITRTFSMAEFRDFMKSILLESGCHNKPILFLLSDTQIVCEEMLEDVISLLNSGEVPNLMQTEDVDQIVEAVRPFASAAGKQETRNVIFSHFVSICRDQVHVVLAMSPVGDKFRRRLRMFPSLVSCCTIDWFDQWPQDALGAVAARVLAEESIEEHMKGPLVELCVAIHINVQELSEEFYDELRRRNYTTPTSYLELLTCYRRLLTEQNAVVAEQIQRYQGGLDTLQQTEVTVEDMKAKLVEMQPRLIQATQDTEKIMEEVVREQDSAEVVRKQCAQEEEVASGIQTEADGIRAECQVELDKALPILRTAENALAELRPDDIREVRSFQKPAARVVLVLEAVLTLLGEKDVSWDRAKLVMSRMEFIKDLQNYKKDELTERTVRSIQKYIANPNFQPEEVAKSSRACKSLAMWVIAINNYYEVVKAVAPKRQRLVEAEGKADAAAHTLQEARNRLQTIEDKLASLRTTMEENMQKKKQLEEETALTTVRLERAEQLMSGLSSEKTRWTQSVHTLTNDMRCHVGTMALAAAFVAYLGPFTSPYRTRMLRSWNEKCKALGIPIGDTAFDLTSIVDPVRVREWAQHGLPSDSFSVENGVIVSKSQRWCLCIDPQGQAANWIRTKEAHNNLRVIKLSEPNYLRTLENAIRVGLPVLIENVEEALDAALDPVLLRQTYRSQGRLLIKLGDTEVDYDPNFRLYITTKLANPLYLPELQIKVTLLNFTVTHAGLENQLLSDVVRCEFAELEQRADQTIVDIANGKGKLHALEDNILNLLSSSTGNILDNEELIAALQSAKVTSEAVSESLRLAEETQAEIDIARNRYRPVATRGSVVYSVLSQLAGFDHMYQHSLDSFKLLFNRTLHRTERRDAVDERVALLLPAVTLNAYSTICRGLFEKDKLTFAFLLYIQIERQQGNVRQDEWMFLLKGSEGHTFVNEDVDPAPAWLPGVAWNEVAALSASLSAFKDLKDDLYDHEEEWEAWYGGAKAYESYPAFVQRYNPWQRLLVLRALREDLVSYGISVLIAGSLGPAFTESPAFDLEGCFSDSTPTVPIIFVLTPGTDPTQLFKEFAEKKGFTSRTLMLSLGQDQGPKAADMIGTGSKEGLWVYLQNCHVYASWMPTLEHILEGLIATPDVHRDFRLWLTTMPVPTFPVLLLQSGVKVVKEPPQGLKANLRDIFTMEITPELWNRFPHNAFSWRRLLCSLAFFHGAVQERRRFGPLGWNIPYAWNQSDFAAAVQDFAIRFAEAEDEAPWYALRFMTGVIHYGGRVTDFLDSRCLTTMLDDYFTEALSVPEPFNFSPDGVYRIPAEVDSLEAMHAYLAALPSIESPELFGLHANADITFHKSAVRHQLSTILSVQPRTKVVADGFSAEDRMLRVVAEFERRLPEPIDKSKAHPDTYRVTDDGTMISLGTVVSQEIDLFNSILHKLRRTLVQLRCGIKGEVVMSAELEAMCNSMLLGQVPEVWHAGSYLSRKPLMSWFDDTLRRVEFFREWNVHGMPASFWISGFFFPQGFLTGVLQTYSRAHRTPIDDVHFETHVTPYEIPDDIEEEITSGVYIHGLFMEGARLDFESLRVCESLPGELHTRMPVLHLEPVRRGVATATESTYSCPVYKTSARVGMLSTTGLSTNYVVSLNLESEEGTRPEHWIKRGVALLCMLDD